MLRTFRSKMLNELIDQRITEETLNQTVDSIANSVQEMINNQTVGECSEVSSLNFWASDPPTQGDLNALIDKINELLVAALSKLCFSASVYEE